MRFARVIGRVTLNVTDPAFKGGRFLIGMPCRPAAGVQAGDLHQCGGNSLVIYDNLGASLNDIIAYTDGGEAAAPFAEPTPCDAYNAAIVDTVSWTPFTPN